MIGGAKELKGKVTFGAIAGAAKERKPVGTYGCDVRIRVAAMIAKLSLAGAVIVVWSVAAGGPVAAACPVAVSVKGGDQDVAVISRALTRFQVSAGGEARCAPWQVTASRAGGQLALQIENGRGLMLIRRVSSPEAAAAVIDSWVHRYLATTPAVDADLTSEPGSLRPTETRFRHARRIVASRQTRVASTGATHSATGDNSAGEPVAPAPPNDGEPPIDSQAEPLAVPRPAKSEKPQALDTDLPAVTLAAAAPVVPTLRRGPISLGLGADASVANDGSVWWGAHVSGCLTVGAFCVGLLLRGDATTLASQGEPGTINRRGVDGLVWVGLPIALGKLTLMPAVGMGGGIRQATAVLRNTDPGEPTAGNGDNPDPTVTVGLRSTTQLTLVIPLWGRLAVDISGVVDGAFANRFRSAAGDAAIPREPYILLRGGVALRYGTP